MAEPVAAGARLALAFALAAAALIADAGRAAHAGTASTQGDAAPREQRMQADDSNTSGPSGARARPGTSPDGDDAPRYSHATLRELVAKYTVGDGESVDYAAWQASPQDRQALHDHVALIARVSPRSHPEQFPTSEARRSYWINTYNALVLAAVLDYWPLESVREVKLSFTSRLIPGKGFFYDRKVVVGGETTNLYDLEKEVLASQKDPRLHFAFNCASESCPVLRAGTWTEAELDQAARDFVNDPANVSVEDGTVYLSPIFKWYRRDFPRDLLVWLAQYAEPALSESLQTASTRGYRKRWRDYDWSLNDAATQETDERG